MGTTPVIKYPYPPSTGLIADGARNIEELAESVEATLFLGWDAFTATDPFDAYPAGQVTFPTSAAGGWPDSVGLVVAIRPKGSNTTIVWFYSRSVSTEYQKAFIRTGNAASGNAKWSPWALVAGPGQPTQMASGQLTVTGQANTDVGVVVTFPANRFTIGPLVFTQARLNPPVMTSPTSITATSFTFHLYRPTTGDTPCYWYAIRNDTTVSTEDA